MQKGILRAASKAVKIWLSAVLAGALLAVVLSPLFPEGAEGLYNALSALAGPREMALFVWIFLKNSLASVCIIFFGAALCILELWIYRGVSPETYLFLERLSDPIYALLDRASGRTRDLKPFFRSCHLYLNFIPTLAALVNGLVLGFYLAGPPLRGGRLSLLLPHGALEVPAMLGSAALAFYLSEELEGPIFDTDADLLLARMKGIIAGKKFLLAVLMIQLLVLSAAYLEAL